MRQNASTLLPEHPVRSETPKCARQVSWLTARSRVVRPSREHSQWPGFFPERISGKKSHFACGLQLRGQLRIRRSLKISSPHSLFIALAREPMHDQMLCAEMGICQPLVYEDDRE